MNDNIEELIKSIDETKIFLGDIILTNTKTKKQLIIKHTIETTKTLLDLPNEILNIIGGYVKKYRYQDKLKYYEDKYYLNDNYYTKIIQYTYKLDKIKYEFIDEDDEDNNDIDEDDENNFINYNSIINDYNPNKIYYDDITPYSYYKEYTTNLYFILKKGDNNKKIINNFEKRNIKRINKKYYNRSGGGFDIKELVRKIEINNDENDMINDDNFFNYEKIYIKIFGENEDFNNIKIEKDKEYIKNNFQYMDGYSHRNLYKIFKKEYNLKFKELLKKKIKKEKEN